MCERRTWSVIKNCAADFSAQVQKRCHSMTVFVLWVRAQRRAVWVFFCVFFFISDMYWSGAQARKRFQYHRDWRTLSHWFKISLLLHAQSERLNMFMISSTSDWICSNHSALHSDGPGFLSVPFCFHLSRFFFFLCQYLICVLMFYSVFVSYSLYGLIQRK